MPPKPPPDNLAPKAPFSLAILQILSILSVESLKEARMFSASLKIFPISSAFWLNQFCRVAVANSPSRAICFFLRLL